MYLFYIKLNGLRNLRNLSSNKLLNIADIAYYQILNKVDIYDHKKKPSTKFQPAKNQVLEILFCLLVLKIYDLRGDSSCCPV